MLLILSLIKKCYFYSLKARFTITQNITTMKVFQANEIKNLALIGSTKSGKIKTIVKHQNKEANKEN